MIRPLAPLVVGSVFARRFIHGRGETAPWFLLIRQSPSVPPSGRMSRPRTAFVEFRHGDTRERWATHRLGDKLAAMRMPEEKIKRAILHPEAEVRLTAVRYFAESHAADTSVMPLVIQAVERYGNGFELLQEAVHLPQSPATVDWLINQLRRPFDTEDYDEDNLRSALALVLFWADPELLARRHKDILALPTFPEPLKGPLDEALKLEFSDWPTLWAAFEELGRQTRAQDGPTRLDNRRFHPLVRAMSRHQEQGAERVITLLQGRCKGFDESLMVWLEPRLVELAGHMRLEAAIPLLLDRIDDDNEAVQEEVGTALARIGGDAVIEAVAERWDGTDDDGRLVLVQPLESIHSDAALSAGLTLLLRARGEELRAALAHCVLAQFATEAIEAVWRMLVVLGEAGVPDYWDLRYRLIATATIMGERFPEYEAWHQEAIATNYGFEKIKDRVAPFRLSDLFAADEAHPRTLRRIRAASSRIYQLKVTLKDIRPPIWRRLLVPDCTLEDLHEIIQIAMGWETYHLYVFEIGGQEYTHPDMDEGELDMEDSTATTLSEVVANEKQKFAYCYDFGIPGSTKCWSRRSGSRSRASGIRCA